MLFPWLVNLTEEDLDAAVAYMPVATSFRVCV